MKLNITIPSNKSEVTLYDYLKYNKIVEENPEAYAFQDMKLIEIFCNTKAKIIREKSPEQYDEILQTLTESFSRGRKFKDVRTFVHNGVEYGFEPDLENIKMGAYYDLDEYIKDVSQLHKAMSILYRPITMKRKGQYLIEPYKGSNDDLLYMPLDIALEAQVFFYRLGSELLRDFQASLIQNPAVRNNPEALTHLQKLGDGIKVFTDLQMESFSTLKRLPKKNLQNV